MATAPEILIVRNQPLKQCESDYRDDPEAFAWDVLGVRGLFKKALEFIWAVAENRKVTCRGAYGTAKTFWGAVLVLWFLYTRPYSRVVTTAPRERQVKDLLWAEINALHARAKFPLGGKCLASRLDISPKWFAVGMTGNQKNQSTMQGYHGDCVFFAGDESSGLPPQIFEIADRLCVGSDDKQLFWGNAIDPLATFAGTFKDSTFTKVCITAFDTPNVQARKTLIPGMVTWDWVEDKRKRWGENSQLYKSRVLAIFPTAAENAMIPLHLIERSMARWEEMVEEVREQNRSLSIEQAAEIVAARIDGGSMLGADVAGGGEDETIFARRREWFHLPLESVIGGTADIVARYEREAAQGYAIAQDAIGVGAGIADMAITNGIDVHKVIGSERSERLDSTGTFGFTNTRTELYWQMREILDPAITPQPHVLPRDEMLLEELALPTYKEVLGKKIMMEPKDKVKERLGRSPDRADATVVSLAINSAAPAFIPLVGTPETKQEDQANYDTRRW